MTVTAAAMEKNETGTRNATVESGAATKPVMPTRVAKSDMIRVSEDGRIGVLTTASWTAHGVKRGRQRKARDWSCDVYDYVTVPEYSEAIPAIGGTYTLKGDKPTGVNGSPAFWRVAAYKDLPDAPWYFEDRYGDTVKPEPGEVKWTEDRVTSEYSMRSTPEGLELARENQFAEAAAKTMAKYAQVRGVLFVRCGEPHYTIDSVGFGDGTCSLTLRITDVEPERPSEYDYTADDIAGLTAFLEEQEAHVNNRGEHDISVSAEDDGSGAGHTYEWREWLAAHPIPVHDPSMLGHGVPQLFKTEYPHPHDDIDWRSTEEEWIKGYAKLIKAISTIPHAVRNVGGVRIIDKTRLTYGQEWDYKAYRDHFKSSGVLIA